MTDYAWELCQWDYHMSLIGNLFQSVHQASLRWFRVTASTIESAGARAALDDPPPH